MKQFLSALIVASSIGLIQPAHAQKTEFWMSNDATSVASFMAHKDKIDIISPTWYQIDQNGFVSGEPQPVVLKAAKDAHLTLIPLFALFNPEKAHALFNDPKAQDALIASLLRECKENGYDGANLDIEDVMWTDRDGLSALDEENRRRPPPATSPSSDRRSPQRSRPLRRNRLQRLDVSGVARSL